MKRKILCSLSLLLLSAMLLSACAQPTPTATTQVSNPAAQAPANPTVAPAQPNVELTMWTWKLNHKPGLDAVAKDFEAKTGIKVTVAAFNPDDAYRTRLTTSSQSGDLADIISYWSGGDDFWNLAGSGVLVDLTSKIDEQWKNSFVAGTFDKTSVLTQARYDLCQKDQNCVFKNVNAGQVFSVPYMAGSAYFVYGNKPLLQQAGLDPNKAPATAEEWLSMMKTVKEKTGMAGVVTGVQNPDVSVRWLLKSSADDQLWTGDLR